VAVVGVGSCEYCRTAWETLCESQQNGGYSVNGSFGSYKIMRYSSTGCRWVPRTPW
jgi:D-arabinose 1-dehydrogenase-like Zn-dependent alcohol dehydrogenase